MTCLQAHICGAADICVYGYNTSGEKTGCVTTRHINRRRDLNKKRFSSKIYNGLRIINN